MPRSDQGEEKSEENTAGKVLPYSVFYAFFGCNNREKGRKTTILRVKIFGNKISLRFIRNDYIMRLCDWEVG